MPKRLEQLKYWLHKEIQLPDFSIEPASGDASFRRYFRVCYDGQSMIVMDAPPDKENCVPFVGIASAFLKIGLNVPEITHTNLDQGFLLMTDLGGGEQLYLQVLGEANADRLYGDAMGALIALQACGPGDHYYRTMTKTCCTMRWVYSVNGFCGSIWAVT